MPKLLATIGYWYSFRPVRGSRLPIIITFSSCVSMTFSAIQIAPSCRTTQLLGKWIEIFKCLRKTDWNWVKGRNNPGIIGPLLCGRKSCDCGGWIGVGWRGFCLLSIMRLTSCASGRNVGWIRFFNTWIWFSNGKQLTKSKQPNLSTWSAKWIKLWTLKEMNAGPYNLEQCWENVKLRT